MNVLVVYFEDKVVGHLKFDKDERLSFQYDNSWLHFKEHFPLTIALPLSEKNYGHLETKSFFENLIPEGELKQLLFEQGKISDKSDFGLLKKFGGDCAGAFKVLPENVRIDKTKKSRKEIKLEVIYHYLKQKKSLIDVILNKEGGKFSLAGAQDKFAVIFEKNKIFLPVDGEASTHIIKPHVRFFNATHDTPYNEYFCMKLAAAVGLNVPEVDIIDGEYPLFIVERFDRVRVNSEIFRVHQQDFCQAHGLTSLKKYESDGGPSFSDNYNLVKANSSAPIPDLNLLLKWLVFNLVIGNNDSHSKNLAFLQTKEGLRLAPFYDLLSTSIYKEIGQTFAFKIGGQNLWFKLKLRLFDKLSSELGLKNEVIPKLSKKLLNDIEVHLPELLKDFQERFHEIKTGSLLEKEILKRVAFFRKIFE